jgi:hypothetical protein
MSLTGRIFRERRRVIVPLLVLFVGNLLALVFVVWPLQRTVSGAEDSRNQAVFALDAARRREREAKGLGEGKVRAEAELKRFYNETLPRDLNQAVGVTSFWLGRVAEESRLLFRTGQWSRDLKREGPLTKVVGQVTLVGEYPDIRRFLYEVETALEFAVVERVELQQSATLAAGSRLEVALTIATYYLTANETAGEGR